MGTFIQVISPDKEAAGIVFSEIQRIESLLSKYKEDSEVVRLNRSGKLKVSPETFYIIKKSREFWELTGGAFDITVGPLADIWGFASKEYTLPQDAQIQDALMLVGSDKIILHEADSVVEFNIPGMKIDLGAIAKGYALDCAAEKLKEKNIKSCLINAGGQVSCLGDKFGKPWRIAVKGPRGKGVAGYLELKGGSAATSGDYEQYFVKGNKRYGHIFDPRTGYPAQAQVSSVTVVAASGLTADALSTAIFVLGKDKAQELMKKFPQAKVNLYD
jgi:thiamine biosynthesis lipoprotein